MKVSAIRFEDYLKCPTKCFLRSQGEAGLENSYAGWVRSQNELYRTNSIKRLTDKVNSTECAIDPPIGNIKRAAWRLAIDLTVAGEHLESTIHSVERILSERRGASAQLIPTRFVFANRLNRDDKLVLAFDALTLSEATGVKVSVGKIVHGDDHVTSKVNTAALAGKLGKLISEVTMLVSTKSPPDLILNRHCAECEFQSRCRQKAIEKDDLSLLSNMTAKERKKLHSKGIFTVTQLSYTFRPRRRPRRLRNKREKYHHALKALAIQKGKIHIVGDPQLKIEGTPVYLDVEALPGRDLYYLIGVRIDTAASVVQRSFWADNAEDEGKIWDDFLDTLAELENPILIHYGSYETTFLKRMSERHGEPLDDSAAAKAMSSALNLVSFLFSRVYFPRYSNTLKDIGAWLGCKWSAAASSGAQSIIWRMDWERSSDPSLKRNLVNYNMEDCHALEVLTRTLLRLCGPDQLVTLEGAADPGVEFADNSRSREFLWRQFSSPIAEFEIINKAARWDYQRDRVYVRTDSLLKRATSIRKVRITRVTQINKDINCPDLQACPVCGRKPDKLFRKRPRVLYDIRFNRFGLARWVVRFHFRYYWCALCNERFGMPEEFWPGSQYGRTLVALIVYETIGQCVPQLTEKDRLNRLFGFSLGTSTVHDLKASAAEYYAETREKILTRMIKGKLIHSDTLR